MPRPRGRELRLAAIKEADMDKPTIAVRGLRKSFGEKEAVAGIDLEIAAGSLAGLVGPNGAGKTTSLSMMTGLLRPDGGQVLINGLDVWADPPGRQGDHRGGAGPGQAVRAAERRRKCWNTPGGCAACPPPRRASRAAQLLDVLDLTADARRLVADYSTGMRKKAALGCALIHNPSVLFLDEPLEGVDPISADVIRRLLTRFVGSGSTVLFSSHVMELVEQVCDHVSIIDKGRIVATGTTQRGARRQDPAAGVHRPGRPAGERRGGTVMARLLVQLKLRLLRNALRASTGAKVSFILSTTFACLLAVGAFVVLALLRGQPASVDLTTVIFTVFAFGWLILPVIAFGLDSTLDPATLALYPLRTRPLAVGLLAASAIGAWPLANLLGLLGVTVGLASGALGVLIAVLAVLLQVLFCITLARFVTTSMARLLRSRRGKDLAAFLFIPIFALYEFFTQVVPKAAAEGKITAASFTGVDCVDALAPAGPGRPRDPGRLGRPPRHRAGSAWRCWPPSSSCSAGCGYGRSAVPWSPPTRLPSPSRVRGGALPLARYGLRGTVAARFWIYQRREPASLIFWGHHRGDHGRRIDQHHPGQERASRGAAGKRGLRRRVRRSLPRQLGRADRAAVRHRGAGADRPPRAAFLLLRPEHRAWRDRGTAAHRDLLRPRGRGRAAGVRLPGHGGGPGRTRRGPGA